MTQASDRRSDREGARRFVITLANLGGRSFVVDGDTPLLETLEDHGVSLPYGCRYGGCISCAAKLLDGAVDQSAGVALNGRQIRDGYVLRVLHETGYDMIPVNPREAGTEIRGLKCRDSLSSIDRPVDMVQIFRTSEAAYDVTREAIDIGAKVVWMQIGVRNDEAAKMAEEAGLKVVMNRCPKIELFRPFWKPRLNQEI